MSVGPEPRERIELEAPVAGDFHAVVRLIIGGIAERVDFAFEEIDDLQLAVERLLAEAGSQRSVRLSFEVGGDGIRTRVGPLSEPALAEALRDGEPRPGELTLKRILQTVVDSFGVDEVERRRHRRAAREAEGAVVSATRRSSSPEKARARGPRAAAPLPRGRRHERPRGADPPPPAARALARAPLRRPRRVARGHRAGRRDRPDQGDRPLRDRARGLARHLRDAERRRRDQAPLPRQGLGDPRAARAAGAQRLDVRRDRAADGQARPLADASPRSRPS